MRVLFSCVECRAFSVPGARAVAGYFAALQPPLRVVGGWGVGGRGEQEEEEAGEEAGEEEGALDRE